MLKVICYGEVLWDVFPTYKKIGGAPLNVCIRLQSFGVKASIISSIGDDENGKELLSNLVGMYPNLPIHSIQINTSYPTGQVKIIFDEKDRAEYTINYPVAWDKIKCSADIKEEVKNSDILVFGSLVCRDDVSESTLLELIKLAKFKVFDVNLRSPFYSIKLIEKLMQNVDFIKFNEEEIIEVAYSIGFKNKPLEEIIKYIINKTQAKIICVTRGGNGAILFMNDTFYYHKGYEVKVKNSVGAGDSFLASIVFKIYSNESPEKALDFACAVGALVACSSGANPVISLKSIQTLIKNE